MGKLNAVLGMGRAAVKSKAAKSVAAGKQGKTSAAKAKNAAGAKQSLNNAAKAKGAVLAGAAAYGAGKASNNPKRKK